MAGVGGGGDGGAVAGGGGRGRLLLISTVPPLWPLEGAVPPPSEGLSQNQGQLPRESFVGPPGAAKDPSDKGLGRMRGNGPRQSPNLDKSFGV